MKATIYTEDGNVCREVECDRIQPYAGMFFRLEGANILTNQTVVLIGQHDGWEHLLSGLDVFDVTLTIGSTVRKWEGARCMVHYGRSISFYHDNQWHTVIGQVLIENMRQEAAS